MKIVSLTPLRNEDWIVGFSLRALLRWVDAAVVLLHACTDETEHIVAETKREFPDRLTVLHETNDRWDEMAHRQRLLDNARILGATHIAMFDADEVLTGNLLPSIRQHVEALAPREMLTLPGYNLRRGIDRYHANGVWGERWFSAVFGDDPSLRWDGDQFHHRAPIGDLQERHSVTHGAGGILHFWGASERRLLARHALYKVVETLRWPSKSREEIDQYYNQSVVGRPWMDESPAQWTFAPVPDDWLSPYRDLLPFLHLDREPWQEEQVRLLVAQYGRERFDGLDLFGLA
jgi:hypothetical protein